MLPRLWIPSLLALTLCACSTPPPSAPKEIDPPPVSALMLCPIPAPLQSEALGRDVLAWALDWVKAYGCEHGKRVELLQAWPQ